MELDNRAREMWIEGVRLLYGQSVIRRAAAMYGLIGVAWSLIVLNQFKKPSACSSKVKADDVGAQDGILDMQLTKARRILDEVSSSPAPFWYLVRS